MEAGRRHAHHQHVRAAVVPPVWRPGPAAPASSRAQFAETLIDSDPDPVLIVTETGRVCFANAAALRPGSLGAVRLVEDRLAARDSADDLRLSRALAAACGGLGSVLTIDGVGGGVRLDVRPLGVAALACVRLVDGAARLDRALADMAASCGLTRSEQALARALAEGVLVTEHARRRGVAISTVRSQAQQLLRKTGVTSQVEFLARLRAQVG